MPQISIVIPAYNAAKDIKECLEAVYKSGFKSFEVIIVDDNSNDETCKICSEFECQVIKNERNYGPAYSRNRGAGEARGEVILFIDSDIIIKEDTLQTIYNFFKLNPNIGILQGRYTDESYYKDVFSKYKNYRLAFRELNRTGKEVAFVNTSIAAMRSKVIKKYKFDESVRRAEDSLFGWRYFKDGNKIILDNNLKVLHKKKYNMKTFLLYQFKSGVRLLNNWLHKDLYKAVLSQKNSVSNRLQLLRAPLSILLFSTLFFSLFYPYKCLFFFLLTLLILSVFLQLDFLIYLGKIDCLMIFPSILIYLIDGLFAGLGVIWGLAKNYVLRVFKVV